MSEPLVLAPNQPPARPYRGGAGIRALRGIGSEDDFAPEDFVASTTCTFGSDTVGLSRLPDGTLLRDAIGADPEGWLGSDHIAAFGPDTALLVKILHTGERLFNHAHPDAAFAAAHLGAERGKTEAWIITDTGPDETADVWLGWNRDVTETEVAGWFAHQDSDGMLAALNRVAVRAGEWIHVPAGTPHSIGEGITLVELQEPVDLSIILEYASFPALDREVALLGLSAETALAAVSHDRTDPSALHGPVVDGSFLPPAADPFYRAERVRGGDALDAGFSVVVVLEGAGSLGDLPVSRGTTVVVPHSAGPLALTGDVCAIRCRPPRPNGDRSRR
jgi:mannose-6-phosphate isomerase